eukprot:1155445-Pelagomonas_calceolata.AAC.3
MGLMGLTDSPSAHNEVPCCHMDGLQMGLMGLMDPPSAHNEVPCCHALQGALDSLALLICMSCSCLYPQ